MPPTAECPSIGELEGALAGGEPAALRHADGCVPCRAILDLLTSRAAAADDCALFEALLASRATDGRGSAADALLRRHSSACPACRELYGVLEFAPTVVPGAAASAACDAPELPVIDPEDYLIGPEHARGGMGRVLLARDRRLGRPVAIKEFLDPGPSARARFEREARLSARLQHPGIVPVYEVGRWPSGEPFYAMRMVPGRSLAEVIAETTGTAERIALLPAVTAVAEAVAYAHGMRIIHRDLKPANVILGAYGETVVVDWGLAKDLAEADAPPGPTQGRRTSTSGQITIAGAVVGTMAYMSPEQAAGAAVDERTDVYALGAILYHVLAGRPPFSGETASQVAAERRRGGPPHIDTSRPWRWGAVEARITDDLRSIVAKAMATDPDARYPTAAELARDLVRYQHGQLVAAHSYSTSARLRRWAARHRAVVVIGAILGTALIGTTSYFMQRVVRERDEAQAERLMAEQQRNLARRVSATLLEEQGRQELLGGSPMRALAFLGESYSGGNRSPSVRFLLAAAARDVELDERSLDHDAPVVAARLSPDGARLVTASGRAARLFRVADGALQATLEGHAAAIVSAFWSADGARLVTAGEDGKVLLWDAASARLVRAIDAHPAPITTVELSADGARLLTAGGDRTIRVWDAARGTPLVEVEAQGRRDDAVRARFDPGGRRFVTWGDDWSVRVWDAATGRLVHTLEGHWGDVADACFSPDGAFVATASGDGTARLWDAGSGESLAQMVGHAGALTRTAFSPDGSRLATASADHTGRIWAPRNGWLIAQLAHQGPVTDVAFSADGADVVTASADKTARRWNAGNGALLATYEGHRGGVVAIDLGRDGARLATAGQDRSARIWSARGGKRRFTLGWSGNARFSADGALLVSAIPGQGTTRLWDARSGRLLHVSEEFGGDLGAGPMPFSPDGGRLVRLRGGDALVKETESGRVLVELASGDGRIVRFVRWAPAGERILTAADDGPPRLWDAATGRLVAALGPPVGLAAVEFSLGGGRLLTLSRDGAAKVWSAADGRLVAELQPAGPPKLFGLSDDGALAFTVGAGGDAAIWRVDGGAPLLRRDGAACVDFDAAGRRAVVARTDGAAEVWSLGDSKPRLVGSVQADATELFWGDLSPDGAFVATAGLDGDAKVWDWRGGRLLAELAGSADVMAAARTLTFGGWSVRFSPDGDRVLTTYPVSPPIVWDARLERRSAAEIAEFVARRAPWRVVNGRVVAAGR